MSQDGTIFDKIIAKEIPANIVYEDEAILAFKDINPAAPEHTLVIPKKRIKGVANLEDMSDAEAGYYFKTIARVAKKLGLEEEGYRVVLNQGRDGGQTVFHIHAHILGKRQMKWPPG